MYAHRTLQRYKVHCLDAKLYSRKLFITSYTHCRTYAVHISNLSVKIYFCLSVAGCYLPQWLTIYVYTKRTCVHQANIYMYTKRSYTIYVRRPYLNLQRIHPCSLCKWNCIRESFLSRHLHCIRRIHITKYKLSSLCRMLLFLYIVFINV